MKIETVPQRASKATRLPSIDEGKPYNGSNLNDLRNCQAKTFRNLLKMSLRQGGEVNYRRLNVEGLTLLSNLNNTT